jgi:hypothetical protein
MPQTLPCVLNSLIDIPFSTQEHLKKNPMIVPIFFCLFLRLGLKNRQVRESGFLMIVPIYAKVSNNF